MFVRCCDRDDVCGVFVMFLSPCCLGEVSRPLPVSVFRSTSLQAVVSSVP